MIPLRLYLYGGALIVLALVGWGIHSAYTNWQDGVKQAAWQSGYDTAHAEVTKTLNDERASVQAEREASERKARETEATHRAAIDTIAQQYEQDKANAAETQKRVVDDLRAGNVRLHQRWQAAVATGELSNSFQSAAQLDAAARDREESASRAIGAAAACDAQVIGLQAIIRADRGM